MNITDQEKFIYNTYLRKSRTKQNKPYRIRKDFAKFDESEYYIYVRRLGLFFKKFQHIRIDNFFDAPYELYPEEDTLYDLKFYASSRGIKVYSLYMDHLDQSNPDTEYHIQYIKNSLLSIFKFCRDNNVEIQDYAKQIIGDVPAFVLHLQRRDVSVYTLFGFDGFESEISKVPDSRLNFTLGKNFTSLLAQYRSRYYNSNKSKQITKQGIKKIKQLLALSVNQKQQK